MCCADILFMIYYSLPDDSESKVSHMLDQTAASPHHGWRESRDHLRIHHITLYKEFAGSWIHVSGEKFWNDFSSHTKGRVWSG